LAADSAPVENHKIADLHVGDGIPNGFDDSSGLVAEEEGKFVVDLAFSMGHVMTQTPPRDGRSALHA
jgi:hypothetical protein